MSNKHLVLMHNYLSPKLCAMRMSLPKTSINIACFAQYNDFSPPTFSVFKKVNYSFSKLNFGFYIYSTLFKCKNNVKDLKVFKQADYGIHLQKTKVRLKEHNIDNFGVYLAVKGNYLTTDSSIHDAQANASSLLPLNNGYKHSNNTTHHRLYQKECTLFLNRVLDHTGRLYIKTIRKNQSKKSNP